MNIIKKSTIADDVIRHDKPGDITEMPSPRRIGHVSIATNERLEEMTEWYCTALNAVVVNGIPGRMNMVSYDAEHHRFAIIKRDDFKEKPKNVVGLFHTAHSYASLAEILFVYQRLKGLGCLPTWSVNHGTTTSFYYEDPDGNEMEIFVDNFDTLAEVYEYKQNVQFKPDWPGNLDFDPEKMIALFEAGVPDATLRDHCEVLKFIAAREL